ncbi:MAG TPA: amino acid adenylation domain-containing protein [Thermoanaerobaculia bacterium]
MQTLSPPHQLETAQTSPHPPEEGEVYLLPVSFAQQRLWFVSRLQPHSSAYNLFGAFSLRGQLDLGALRQSLDEIVRRHELLRTAFALFDGQPVQVVTPDLPAHLTVVDFRGRAGELWDAEIERLLDSEASRPFALERGPLFRTFLLQIAAEEHIFLYVMHHIITDGWSEAILVREMVALYQAYCAGRPSPLPELPIQYGDFAQWQRDWLQGQVLEDLLAYWKAQLAGVPEVLELPADRPRPPVFTYRGATVGFSVPVELTNALQELGQSQGATLFMILVAAFGVFLARHSGQEDIVVGTPIANRNQVELEGLIGFFVNTLVLRIDLSGNPTFPHLLARVRETVYAAQEHQDLPFERLVTELKLERNPSINPLFQALMALDNTPRERLDLGGEVSLQPFRFGKSRTAKFDLMVGFVETRNGLSGSLEYSTDLFDEATVRRMVARFQVLLTAIADDPGRTIADLPLLAEEERQALLFDWAPPTLPSGRAACLHERFSMQARKTPRAIAASCEDGSLTYEELDRRSDALARLLGARIAGRHKRVGICLERSLDMLVAILSTLKAGAAYVPLDPAYPQERLEYLLRDSGVPVLVTASRLLGALPSHDCAVELIDELGNADGGEALDGELRGVAPESPAYVIYTSGSTGDPKGVEVSHRNVLRLFEATQDWFGFSGSDVWTLFHSYAFDFSVWEMWGAWLYGGRLVVVPYWISRSPEQLHRLLRDERVTVLSQIPSAFYPLMREVMAGDPTEDDSLALRYVVFGGEALEPRKLSPWFDRFGDERPRLVNMYGITETTVHVTYRPVLRHDLESARTSPIGVPIPDLRVHVLDRFGQLAPLGVPGEMCIGGAGLAMGYLGRPALTAARFVPDPFAGEPGARLYRSGDLARWSPELELDYLGRIDHQVKVRGFRIEPGEIEAVLARAPEIAEAAVVVRERGREKFLAAYLVPKPGAEVRIEALRAFLKEKLPEYMVPAAFLSLDALPLTPSGKLDRKALPDPDSARPDLEVSYVAPRDEVEQVLADAWSAVLGVERIGVHDNFFSLGGDSIRSIGALAQIREKGLDLSLQQLFQHPTIAELAAQVRPAPRDEDSAAGPAAPFSLISAADRARLPEDLEDAYPLTSLQAGMLFHREQTLDAPVFHNLNSWHLRLEFDRQAFEKALLHLAARHPILRTSFDLTSYSEPLQLVHRQAVFPVEVEDLRGLSEVEQAKVIAAFCDRELHRPFDLSAHPQIRFHIHLRGDGIIQFTLTENHAILDGWSLHTLFDDLLRLYFAFLRGESPDLPALQTRFRDFVALERHALSSPEFREFWDRRLSGGTVLKLPRWPGSSLRPGEQRLRSVHADIPIDVNEALSRLAQAESVPLKSVYLAAHLKVLSFFCGQTDLLTGLSSNGRIESVDGHRVCGLFLNTLPLRQRLPGGSWRELVRQTHENEKEMLPYRRYPLGAVQERWGREALLETSFVYLNFHVMKDVLRSEGLQQVEAPAMVEQTNFAVMTAFQHSLADSSAIHLSMNCDRAVLDDAQIDALAGYYLATLRAMALDPSSRYDLFCPLSEAERTMILAQWNDAPSSSPVQRGLAHERFEEQAERAPDLACLVSEGESLDFSEVNRRANQLANRLRRTGVGPEHRVAICLERSPELVVAILGVLKAGAAYVPLDPASPPERLRSILEDAQAAAVLTAERWREPLSGCRSPLICLDVERIALEAERSDNPAHTATAANLAYVIYTSGSTGTPKGVAVEHRQLAAYLNAVEERLVLPAGARYAWLSTPAADLGHTMLFPPLVLGATLHVLSETCAQDPHLLAAALDQFPADCLKIVPSQLGALLESSEPERLLPRQRLILGGEAADWPLIERLRELTSECRIFNHYGPTETTVGVLVHSLNDESPEKSSVPPLGRPLAGNRAYLLDSCFQPVPAGTPAELFIGGSQVARGYMGRPDQTAERFVPDPLSAEPGARLYRSGDLARHLPDGRMEFLGRIDHQVKIRGFRVELGEIEAVLKRHPQVRAAAVLARSDAGEKRLVAYVVPNPGAVLDVEELRRDAAATLPSYMQPAAFVQLAALPLTPNGKLDRKALPDPGESSGERRPAAGPRDPLELQLVQLWEEILGTRPIGIRDDFFASGGNSLMAVRLVAQVRRQLGHRLPLTTLLETPTIERLAAILRAEMPPPEQRHLIAVQPRGVQLPLFFVHPGHGSVSSYLGLARHLGVDQPLYGLQARDLDREGDAYMSVEELASRYLAEVREKQPQGPYLIGGWSFGGLVAFEMAQQLRQTGEETGALLLLDTRTPAANAPLAALEPSLMKAYLLIEHAKQVAHLSVKDLPVSPHDLVGLELEEQIDRLMNAMKDRDALPRDIEPSLVRRYLELRVARFLAIKNYRPDVYPGPITLFRAAEVYTDTSLEEAARIFEEISRKPTYGWDELTIEPVIIHHVPGNHESMIYEPHVQALARAIAEHLDDWRRSR